MSDTAQNTERKVGRPRKKLGRPTIMTRAVLDKLEEAFAIGCTDSEACFYAGISDRSLHKYQERNKDFYRRKLALKENPVLLARKTMFKAIQTDPDAAKWFLERKKRDEFGQKVETDTNINVTFTNSLPRPNLKSVEAHAISSVPKVIDAEVVKKDA